MTNEPMFKRLGMSLGLNTSGKRRVVNKPIVGHLYCTNNDIMNVCGKYSSRQLQNTIRLVRKVIYNCVLVAA